MKTRMLAVAAIAATSLAACATQPRAPAYGYDRGYSDPYDRGYSQQRCYDCGRIERIEQVYGARRNSRAGAVLGGLVGAVAAREIPTHGSEGKENTATVAGNAIEQGMSQETLDIHVRMDDGRLVVLNRNRLGNGIREGAYVRVDGNNLELLR